MLYIQIVRLISCPMSLENQTNDTSENWTLFRRLERYNQWLDSNIIDTDVKHWLCPAHKMDILHNLQEMGYVQWQ